MEPIDFDEWRVPVSQRIWRIVITGSECTGKTTLARFLGQRFQAPWAEEYSRVYAERKGAPLTAEDVEPIARGQMELEDAARRAATSLVFLDTDLISTVLYARHYYGVCPRWIEEAAWQRRADLYLLCPPDVPWAPDRIRDRGSRREEMHRLFEAILPEFAAVTISLRGSIEEREMAAIEAIRSLAGDSGRPGSQ